MGRELDRFRLRAFFVRTNQPREYWVDPRLDLGDMAVRHLPYRTERVFSLPPGRAHREYRVGMALLRVLPLIVVPVVIVFLAASYSYSVLAAVVNLLLIAGLILVQWKWPRSLSAHRYHYSTADGDFALDTVFDERPHREAARAMVDEVKETYGALLSDLVYRIENPALFDPAFPAARAFTSALISWDTAETTLSPQELGSLAADVRVRFEAARAESEAIGFDYLPAEAREPAGRALKAARLATGTGNDAERRAALKTATEILGSLAIYYLPNPREAREMIARMRPNPRPTLEQTIARDFDVLYTELPNLVDEVWLTPLEDTTLAQLGPMTRTSSPLRAITIPPVRTSRGLFNRSKASIASFGALRLDGSNIVENALARVQGERPEPQAHTDRRAAILRRGRAVVDDYAALKLDVAYRIENSALFDPSVPTTHALEVALVRWDGEAQAASITELDDLASELEIAYSVAHDHAETVGFSHLPGAKEADARRAAKAARLAERATTQGERLAAQQQVVRILDSLALHYLPTAEARRLALPKCWN